MRRSLAILAMMLVMETSRAQAPVNLRTLTLGDKAEHVRQLLGRPQRVSRQVLFLRTIEQWHYGMPHQVRLTFEAPRGQQAHLVSVQQVQMKR